MGKHSHLESLEALSDGNNRKKENQIYIYISLYSHLESLGALTERNNRRKNKSKYIYFLGLSVKGIIEERKGRSKKPIYISTRIP